MTQKIKCYDYRGKFEETYIPEDVCILVVKILTGDECIEMYREEPEFGDALELIDEFDPFCMDRRRECLDAMYIIRVWDDEEFNNWNDNRIKPKKHYINFGDLLYDNEEES